ncbi:arginine decarboxylase, pyruvoyl-dependent [Methanocorpusculum sp.]|nr:arginine decarboxylase, pyruvoyl-dependent [Methanocorpusculum sp.]
MFVPSKVFFTKGVGVHKEKLVSFEMALRDAHVSPFNLVTVSSIMPPQAKIVSREEGLSELHAGEIVFCVMARGETNTEGEAVAASVGLAVPPFEQGHHGFLSEHHGTGISADECGIHAEDLAATMLGSLMNIDIDPKAAWDEREQAYLASGRIIKTSNVSSGAVCENGLWTTVVSLAVFVP